MKYNIYEKNLFTLHTSKRISKINIVGMTIKYKLARDS